MFGTLRAAWRLSRAVLHGLRGLFIVLFLFGRLDRGARHRHIQRWSAVMFARLGMRMQVQGALEPGAKLIVANHVSWLDILAVHAVCPEARFVSKADVRQWPLIRHLVDAADTLYIERERRRDAMRVVHQTAEALQQGDTVAVFPEGTTGPGPELLPLHANLLQAAISAQAAVQPVVLRYADAHRPFSPAAAYETTLTQSLWSLAGAERLTIHITILPALASADAGRRALAERLREQFDTVLARSR